MVIRTFYLTYKGEPNYRNVELSYLDKNECKNWVNVFQRSLQKREKLFNYTCLWDFCKVLKQYCIYYYNSSKK